jgi:hypothetical protein
MNRAELVGTDLTPEKLGRMLLSFLMGSEDVSVLVLRVADKVKITVLSDAALSVVPSVVAMLRAGTIDRHPDFE